MDDDVDSSELTENTVSFLNEKQEGERALEAVLEVNDELETWTFEDVPLDSGTFGELVSRGIVEKVDGTYQVADAGIVAAAVAGEDLASPPAGGDADGTGGSWSLELGVWGDARAVAGLAGALAVLLVMRIIAYPRVFRDDHIVSPGNDPYHYRWGLNELLEDSTGLTDWSVIADLPWWANSRPFTHATNWFVAELLGGTPWAADMVAAWLPVASALAVGILIYVLAVLLTDDPRIGIASVVLFALMPVQAVYSGVGFLEHRLHQYFWLAVTLVSLAFLAVDLRHRTNLSPVSSAAREHLLLGRTWFATVVLGVALGVSAHIWGGAPLVFIPLAAYIALRTVSDVRRDVRPFLANLPLVIGLGIASVIAGGLHLRWDWHEPFVAFTPLLVFVGAISVLLLGELWRSLEWPVYGLLGTKVLGGTTGSVLLWIVRPDDAARIVDRFDDLWFRDSAATEAASLFTTEYAVIFGPLQQLGVGFYLALAVLGWAVVVSYRRYEPAWLLMSVYTGYFIVLAGLQVRFAAQLGLLIAVLGGIGFVYGLSKLDLARDVVLSNHRRESHFDTETIAIPDSRTAGSYIIGVFLLVCGLSLIFVPGFVGQVAYDDGQYEAMVAIEEHASEVDRLNSSEDFVLSNWGDNRMYNYFLSGEARMYGYAQETFDEFRFDDDPDGWYRDEFDGDVGYVVLNEYDGELPRETTQSQLHDEFGLQTDESETLEHYQLLYVDDDQDVVAFAAVSGVTIKSAAEPGETVAVETDVSVTGESFTYERTAEADESGELEVTVPYPGEYRIGDERLEISSEEVVNGDTIQVE